MKYPCYTTKTGLKIGCAYQPPLRSLSYEETRIQSALLGEKRQSLSFNAAVWVCLGLIVAIVWIGKP
jgi:hypothetical protein